MGTGTFDDIGTEKVFIVMFKHRLKDWYFQV